MSFSANERGHIEETLGPRDSVDPTFAPSTSEVLSPSPLSCQLCRRPFFSRRAKRLLRRHLQQTVCSSRLDHPSRSQELPKERPSALQVSFAGSSTERSDPPIESKALHQEGPATSDLPALTAMETLIAEASVLNDMDVIEIFDFDELSFEYLD